VRRVIPPTNPIVRNAFPLLVFFLAAIFSGVWEKMPFLASFHVLTLLGGVALIVVGLGGRLPVLLRNPIAQSLVVFTAWLIICIPFAFWPGGSFALMQDVWSRAFLAFLLVAGCVLTVDQAKTIFKTIGYSVGVLSITALVLRGVDKTGRLGLLGTRYEDANDFAWTLILGFCFLTFLIVRGSRSQKLIALLLSATILLALVKTGSRGGMIGLGMLGLVGFFQSSRAVRIKLAFAIPVLLVLLYAAASPELRGRYTTLFGSGEDYTGRYLGAEERLKAAATDSANTRWSLLRDSIYLTLRHPVLGVGPKNFMPAQNELAISRGQSRGEWRETHNTYTQISSEMGIVGLVIYLVFLYQCFKSLNSIVRSRYPGKEWDDLRAVAKSLRAALVVVQTIAFFDSYGYDPNITILAGLACALSLIAQRHRALLTAPPQVTLTSLHFNGDSQWTTSARQ